MSKPQNKTEAVINNEQLTLDGPQQTFTPLQAHYYDLLRHLIPLKNKYQSDPNFDSYMMQSIKKAIYSALTDCIEAQIGDAAKELLRREHQVN